MLANSSWYVREAQKQSANKLANCWQQIGLASILANFSADKLGFIQTFLFLHRFLFFHFFSSVSLLYVSATTLKKRPCCKLPCLIFYTSLTRVKERDCQLFDVFQHEFACLSLPCEGRLSCSLTNDCTTIFIWALSVHCRNNISFNFVKAFPVILILLLLSKLFWNQKEDDKWKRLRPSYLVEGKSMILDLQVLSRSA